MGALKIWNPTTFAWEYAGKSNTPGWRKVGVSRISALIAVSAVEYNVGSAPVTLRNGYTYRVRWRGLLNPNTAGMFTTMKSKYGAANAVAGTFLGRDDQDHRIVGRFITGFHEAVVDWTAADLVTNINVTLIGGGGSVGVQADTGTTYGNAYMTVEECLT